MDINMTIIDYTPIFFTLHPVSPSFFSPPSPGYAVGNNPGLVIPLGYSVIEEGYCAMINGPCDVIGVEDQTWGGVKALYR